MSIIERVLVILKEKNLRQKDLTDYLGITPNAFTDWKSGRIKSYTKYLPQIAEFLGVSVDYLCEVSTTEQLFPQQKKLAGLIAQLDERDQIKLEGIIEEMLRADKYTAKKDQVS